MRHLPLNKVIFFIASVLIVFGLWLRFYLDRTGQVVELENSSIYTSQAIVLPHHDLLLDHFDEFYQNFSLAERRQIQKIIILSPNHYQPQVSRVVTDRQTTLADHGVALHLPFIKKYFPEAKVESFLLSRKVPRKSLEKLVNQLNQEVVGQSTLVLVSTDFSHYLDKNQAQQRDSHAQQLICQQDVESILQLSDEYLDCPGCMYVLLNLDFMKQFAGNCPTILFHKNSQEVMPGSDDVHTTSYFVMRWRQKTENDKNMALASPSLTSIEESDGNKSKEARLLFGGDLSFDRYIRQMGQAQGYDFILTELKDFLGSYDAVIVNLESPITQSKSVSLDSAVGSRNNYIFTSPVRTAQVLADHNIKIVNLGNNHTLNFGQHGLIETRQHLANAHIDYFGNLEATGSSFLVKNINGIQVGLVNHNQFTPNSIEKALHDLQTVRSKSDVVIVYAHWGEEYVVQAGKVIQNQAHQFIKAGADLVIGSHPHVIQQTEVYQGKKIYYSLGNFVFDQYFSPETRRGLLLEVILTDQHIETKEHFVNMMTNGQTVLAE